MLLEESWQSGSGILHTRVSTSPPLHALETLADVTHRNQPSLEENALGLRSTSQTRDTELESSVGKSRRPETETPRFVGDLNPESIFIVAQNSAASKETSDLGDVGVWSMRSSDTDQAHTELHSSRREGRPYTVSYLDPTIEPLSLSSLKERCLIMIPSSTDFEALSNIYFQDINPIIPVMDRKSLELKDYSQAASILLRQGISLAACVSPAAVRHLNLPSSRATLSQLDFAQKIAAAMRTSIEIGLVTDKIAIIQAYALFSMFMQTHDGGDISAQMSGLAVHHVHSLGLHLDRRKPNEKHIHEEVLFCIVWALDRLSAAFHGRPVLMHERDIGRDLQACVERQSPCFRLLLRVIQILDAAIQLYRPKSATNIRLPMDQIPDFEDLVLACEASREELSLLATIEVFYHAVCILSCRSSFNETPDRSSPTHIRQAYAAYRITSIVSQEFHNQLSLIPIVPYAVSLALSVAYRELRYSKVPMYQRRARAQLQVNCNLLKELGNVFWSAAVLAELGEQVLKEMNRVLSSRADPSTQEPDFDSHDEERISSFGRPVVIDATSSHTQHPGELSQSAGVELSSLDPSILDNVPDFDIFGQFDSSFDLDAIDAALGGGHLDLSLPLDFGDLWQS